MQTSHEEGPDQISPEPVIRPRLGRLPSSFIGKAHLGVEALDPAPVVEPKGAAAAARLVAYGFPDIDPHLAKRRDFSVVKDESRGPSHFRGSSSPVARPTPLGANESCATYQRPSSCRTSTAVVGKSRPLDMRLDPRSTVCQSVRASGTAVAKSANAGCAWSANSCRAPPRPVATRSAPRSPRHLPGRRLHHGRRGGGASRNPHPGRHRGSSSSGCPTAVWLLRNGAPHRADIPAEVPGVRQVQTRRPQGAMRGGGGGDLSAHTRGPVEPHGQWDGGLRRPQGGRRKPPCPSPPRASIGVQLPKVTVSLRRHQAIPWADGDAWGRRGAVHPWARVVAALVPATRARFCASQPKWHKAARAVPGGTDGAGLTATAWGMLRRILAASWDTRGASRRRALVSGLLGAGLGSGCY